MRRSGLALALAALLLAAGCGRSSRRAAAPLPPEPLPPSSEPAAAEPATPSARVPDKQPRVPKPGDPLPPRQIGSFEERHYNNESGQDLPYLLYRPAAIEPGKTYPLVLFLHSAKGSGSDDLNEAALNRMTGLAYWTAEEIQQRFPCFVVAPRADPTVAPTWVRQWRSTPDPAPHLREPLELAVELVRDQLSAELPIDDRRLYVTGYSMGAFGAWIAISRHPGVFAAAVPIAGGGDPTHIVEADAAVWAVHGGADTVVPASRSREMIEALRSVGREPLYTEIPGVGHNAFRYALEIPGLIEWLFDQRR